MSTPNPVQQTKHLLVDLPAGGRIPLKTQEEVDLWKESAAKYIDDYQLIQQNDLNLLGAILMQQMILFRQQQVIAGMEAEIGPGGVPTGRYVAVAPNARSIGQAQAMLIKASDEIQKIEKSLGIDKKTREAGGQHTVQQYVLTLKSAGREFGLHISQRLTEYERVCMDARQRIRILRNADPEDRAYHNVTADTIVDWLYDELGQLEELDKQFAKTKQALYLGRV